MGNIKKWAILLRHRFTLSNAKQRQVSFALNQIVSLKRANFEQIPLKKPDKHYTKRILLPALVSVMGLHMSISYGASDPCDFTTGAPGFSAQQVLECYHRVPANNATRDAIANSLETPKQVIDLAIFYKDSGFPLFTKADISLIQQDIRNMNQSSDFAMQEAIKEQFKLFENPHWGYTMPLCYHRLQPFMPLVISSKMMGDGRKSKQMLYIKSNAIRAELYEQTTGINTDNLIGQTLVSINGVPAVQAIANDAQHNLRFSSFIGNNFATHLQDLLYQVPSIRSNLTPENLSPEYAFKDSNGDITTVTLPWVFVPREMLFGAASVMNYPPLASSTTDFVSQCQQPWDTINYLSYTGFIDVNSDGKIQINKFSPVLGDKRDDKMREKFTSKIKKISNKISKHKHKIAKEVKVLPYTLISSVDGISYGQLGKNTTVITVADFDPADVAAWIETLTDAKAYACQHSKTVMIDYSSNPGGLVSLTTYLAGLFNPSLADGSAITYRMADPFDQTRPLQFNSLINVRDFLSAVFGGCVSGLEAQCKLREDGSTLLSFSSLSQTQGLRGKEITALTEKVTPNLFLTGISAIPSLCPGKFTGKNLIQITDGANASGGAIAPASLRKLATNVTYHGIIGEPSWLGSAQGGSVVPYNLFYSTFGADAFALQGLADIGNFIRGALQPPLPVMVDFRFENEGGILDVYHTDKLLLAEVLLPDVRVPIWDNDDPSIFYSQILHSAKHATNRDKVKIYLEYLDWVYKKIKR